MLLRDLRHARKPSRLLLERARVANHEDRRLTGHREGRLDPEQLAQWILDDRLPLRFQLQLHQILWGHGKAR